MDDIYIEIRHLQARVSNKNVHAEMIWRVPGEENWRVYTESLPYQNNLGHMFCVAVEPYHVFIDYFMGCFSVKVKQAP